MIPLDKIFLYKFTTHPNKFKLLLYAIYMQIFIITFLSYTTFLLSINNYS